MCRLQELFLVHTRTECSVSGVRAINHRQCSTIDHQNYKFLAQMLMGRMACLVKPSYQREGKVYAVKALNLLAQAPDSHVTHLGRNLLVSYPNAATQ